MTNGSHVLNVNVIGIARVTRAALPFLLKSKHAAIVNTCSVVADIGLPQRALYSASKGAVRSLTFAMAADFIKQGIRVNAVTPGTADTPWVQRLLEQAPDADGGRSSAACAPADGPPGHRRRDRLRDRLPGEPPLRGDHRDDARGRRRPGRDPGGVGVQIPTRCVHCATEHRCGDGHGAQRQPARRANGSRSRTIEICGVSARSLQSPRPGGIDAASASCTVISCSGCHRGPFVARPVHRGRDGEPRVERSDRRV